MRHAPTVLALIFGFGGAIAPAQDAAAPRRILIVSPSTSEGPGPGYRDLLKRRGFSVSMLTWGKVSKERAAANDLIIVTGAGRPRRLGEVVLDFERPVLGLGSYGCMYFGRLRLKHGHPYT